MSTSTPLWRNIFVVLLLLIFSFHSYAQTKTVRGTVTNEAGLPLPGVTVSAPGTTAGTSTNDSGQYVLSVPAGASTLRFSNVGYEQQNVTLAGRTEVNTVLHNMTANMSEVVVVGYGTAKRSDVTGSVTSVSAKTLQERPVQNALQGMQGKASGVDITSNLRPGETPNIRIRGNRSLTASNEPLYVVDGIPIVNALGVTSFTINDINPNDIASIEILKDASATAIYGSRGANGVILVTTKKGAKGRVTVNYNATVTADWYKSLTDWMDGGQYVDRWRESLINARQYKTDIPNNGDLTKAPVSWYPDPALDIKAMALTPDPIALQSVLMGYEWADRIGGTVKTRATTAEEKAMGWPDQVPVYNPANIRNYDWIDAATRTGMTNSHQLSLTAGTANSKLALSLGYFGQKGVQRDQDFKRYNASINGDITPLKWLTLGTSILGSFSLQNYGIVPSNNSNTGSKDLFGRAANQFPFAQPKDSAGNWITNPGPNINIWNPLIDLEQVKNERRTSAVMTNLFTDIKFTSWLRYRLNFGVQYRHFRSGSWTGPQATPYLTNRANTAGYSTDENFSWVAENLLYADKTFGDHAFGLTLLQSSQSSRKESINTSVTGVINPLSLWYDLASNTSGNPGYGTGFTENSLSSFMARVNYTLMDRYLLTASGRYDGSSVLAPGHKWTFFPSAALAWKLHEEPFMRDLKFINELKPRLGYGVVGNSSVNPYTTSGPLSRNNYVFASTPGIGYLPQLVQNPNLGWEKTASLNAGVDFRMLNSRLSGSVEVYEHNTTDLLLTRTLPAVSGYVQKIENVGATRNRGVEITLSTVNIQKGNFSWNTDLNWSRNREEVVELMNGKQDMVANNLFIGYPAQVFYQWQNAGIWGTSAKEQEEMAKWRAKGVNFYPGTIKVVDQNGDYNLDGQDLRIVGTNRPKWTGGVTNTLRYKDWTFISFVYFRWGQTYFGAFPNSFGGSNPNGRVENDVWSWTNQGGRWPMPMSAGVTNYTGTMQYDKGSFGVVRNISLSYSFPKNMLGRTGLSNLTLNAQVLNPFMFGPGVVKMGLNPEDDTNWTTVSGSSGNTSPIGGSNNNTILPQSFVFSLRAGF
ncbi:SusC/RagA family TonB-linked outer membrane protein [Paraflavisolibacter sp. H34]|uniref:SusC/RagA family TonB-linked outer membrane protein n=1 Tax=Huijunlia imazamoxiresistens TaxID=3127457 RepID=UPI003016863C